MATTPGRITDPDIRLLAGIAGTLRGDYEEQDKDWQSSPFAWIKAKPSRQVGKIGEQLVAGWCAAKGLDVTRPGSPKFDRVIHGYRVEVKFSTLWKAGRYVLQQIRDQDYQYAICLGVSPFDAHCWVISKDLLLKHVIGHMGQHTGHEGSDTAWLHVRPDNPLKWLSSCGGSLRTACDVLQKLPPGPHSVR